MQKLVVVLLFLLGSAFANVAAPPKPNGSAEHIVVLVWDGMRPDFITPQHCPTLYSLTTTGTFSVTHPSSTLEVNGARATGATPGGFKPIAISVRAEFLGRLRHGRTRCGRRGDLLSGGDYLAPPLAEALQNGRPDNHRRWQTSRLVSDRSARKESDAAKQSVTLFEAPKLAKVNEDKPFYTTVTFRTPGGTTGPRALWCVRCGRTASPNILCSGSANRTKTSMRTASRSTNALAVDSSDKNLTGDNQTLGTKTSIKTDIFVVSDHGFSTISAGPDLSAILKKQKFRGGTKLEDPEPGDVIAIGLGGSVVFYVIEHDEAVTRRLVEFLQTTDFAGVIFSRQRLEGTFPLESVGYSSSNSNAPDVLLSLRWTADRNDYGAPGSLISAGGTSRQGRTLRSAGMT
jgi:hypothetical protein